MSADLERIENLTATFEKIALAVGILLLLLALWVRAPHFQINPVAGVGFGGILGFNAGHAIVFGPVIVFLALATYVGLLGRREMLRQAFCRDLAAGHYGEEKLSTGARLVLDKFRRPGGVWSIADFADRGTRTLWFFILPILALAMCIERYFDLLPEDNVVPFTESKGWSLSTRIVLHLFSRRMWAVRAALPDRYLDANESVRAQMPYIYSPLQTWIYLALLVISIGLAVRAWQLYFRVSPLAADAAIDAPGGPAVTTAQPPSPMAPPPAG